jgi:uncharacterized membrane protein
MEPDSKLKPLPTAVSENIEALEAYYARMDRKVSAAQRLLEHFSRSIGRPWFLGLIAVWVLLWIGYNVFATRLGLKSFDPPPFSALQGLVSLSALLATTVVLIGQNRIAQLERQREELALQVNILTEQKTTKLLHLLEELRQDLPMVRDRHDPDAAKLRQPTDTTDILTALEKGAGSPDKEGAALR